MSITQVLPTTAEIVLQEKVVSNEFKIVRIEEDIVRRNVNVEIELGPFVEETNPQGEVIHVRATSRRGINVWSNEEYDAVRDTWKNEDLIAAVKAKM